MSTILRALRRLEQEKAADELVELHESVVAPAPAPAPRRGRAAVLVAVAAVAAAALGGVVTWQWLGGPGLLPFGEATVDVAAAPAPRPPVPGEEPSDAALENALALLKQDTAILVDPRSGSARLAPVAAAPPRAAGSNDRAALDDGIELDEIELGEIDIPGATPEISSEVVVHRRTAKSAAAAADAIVVARRAPEPAPEVLEEPPPAPQPRVLSKPSQRPGPKPARTAEPKAAVRTAAPVEPRASAPTAAPRTAEPAPRPKPASVVEPEPTPATEPEPVRVAAARPEPEPETGSWRQARPAAVAPPSTGIPNVSVTKTVWHPSPERRSAIVEVEGSAAPLDLKEGDKVGDLVLTQIKPSGVVFDYDGVELVRKIGGR